jgi:hypothetical protein
MVAGETTPDTSNVTWERVTAASESITGYDDQTYVWKFTITAGATAAIVSLTDTSYTTADMHGLKAGLTYKGIAQIYTKSTGGVAYGDIDFLLVDYDGSNTSTDLESPTSADAWNEVEVELTFQSDATGWTLRFDVDAGDAVAGEYFYVGLVRLEPVGTHNEHDQQYVDNGTGTQVSSNSWQRSPV